MPVVWLHSIKFTITTFHIKIGIHAVKTCSTGLAITDKRRKIASAR